MRGSTLPAIATLLSALGPVAAQDDSAGGLEIDVTFAVECERVTKKEDVIFVNYNGTLVSGEQFDSSYDDEGVANPFRFTLGVGQVIRGWDLGLLDMCIGERRTLTLPPDFGYGGEAVGPIPPNSVLIFETELTGIEGVPTPEKIVPEKKGCEE